MLGKILGGNKKPKYFLELGEQKNGAAAPQEAAKAEVKTEAPAKEPAKAETQAEKKAEPAKVEKKVAAAPAPAPASVKPAVPANNGRVSAPAATNFATDYLLPKPSASRRRPGPSMNMFRDMARQVGRR